MSPEKFLISFFKRVFAFCALSLLLASCGAKPVWKEKADIRRVYYEAPLHQNFRGEFFDLLKLRFPKTAKSDIALNASLTVKNKALLVGREREAIIRVILKKDGKTIGSGVEIVKGGFLESKGSVLSNELFHEKELLRLSHQMILKAERRARLILLRYERDAFLKASK